MRQNGFMRAVVAISMTLAVAIPAKAYDFAVDGIYYNILDETATVAVTYQSSNSYSGDIEIPSIVKYSDIEYSVTKIGNYAFDDCTGLTSIALPSSVTSIGDYAFYGCIGLTSIELPSSVTSIGDYVFYNCTGLTSIELPSSLTTIVRYAFSGCTGLTSVEFPSSLMTIEEDAFSGCTGLTSIELPSSVTSIGMDAFEGCTGLTSIELPSSVTLLGESAFSGCSGLESIVVNSGNQYYDSRDGCNAIIETSSNTLIIGCKNTKIPSSVTSIGLSAFEGCTGLTSIEIPNSVTSIGWQAFYDCCGLISIELPNSVTSIGEYAFLRCSGLESIVVNSGNQYYDSRDGCNAIIETSSNTLMFGCENTKIPSSVTSIGSQAFSGCTGLTSIEIPNSVTSIGLQAFYDCSSLTSIKLPSSLTSIDESTFQGCTGLTSIELPSSLTTIGFGAFQDCTGLTSIDLPNSLTSIGGQAFSGCTGLTSIELPRSLTSLGSYVFYGCSRLKTVFYNAVNLSKVDYDDFENKKNVTTIIVGKEVENMLSIFSDYTECTTIVSVNPIPPVCEEGAFANIDKSTCVLYVPKDSYLDYWEANEWKEFANIKAIEHEVTGLSLDDISIPCGTSLQLENIITPENATIKILAWTNSNPNIAEVSSTGLISGVSVGETTITATATDGSGIKASCKVTVTPVLAESIKLNKSSVIMDVYESEVLATTILPSNTSDKSVTWSSSDESVARIQSNDDGSVTVMLIAEGYAVITATTNDGSNLSASCVVSSTAGIDDVVVDDNAPAEYYNLQGVKVDNPTNGLYIKKQGGKATKVIL